MTGPRLLAEHGGRELYLVVRPGMDAWDGWYARPQPFTLIAWIDEEKGDSEAFARSMTAAGVRAALCAGPRGGELEDAFDRVLASAQGDVVLTTNNEGQPLDEVLWEAFYTTPEGPVFLVLFSEPSLVSEAERLSADLEAAFAAVEEREP